MLYTLLKVLTWIMMRVYFRKIHFSGRDRIPADKPLVIMANHQSAFIEPILFASNIRPSLHYITRGDVFIEKYMWFFRWTNQIPIFRARDGVGDLRKNISVLDRCHEVLGKGGKILIFSQPGMKWEKRVSRVKNGGLRMALGAIEKYPGLDVHILPVGINYTDHTSFRSDVMMQVGQPFPAKEYLESQNGAQRDALGEMTEEVARQLRSLIIHIEDPEDDWIVNRLLEIKRNNLRFPFLPVMHLDGRQFAEEHKAAETWNSLEDKSGLKTAISDLFNRLGKVGIPDRSIARWKGRPLAGSIVHLLLSPLYVLGFLLNIIPPLIGDWIATTTTSNNEFYSSVRIAASAVLYLFYYALLTIGFFLYQPRFGYLAGSVIPLSGILLLYARDRLPVLLGRWKFAGLPAAEREQLLALRREIDNSI